MSTRLSRRTFLSLSAATASAAVNIGISRKPVRAEEQFLLSDLGTVFLPTPDSPFPRRLTRADVAALPEAAPVIVRVRNDSLHRLYTLPEHERVRIIGLWLSGTNLTDLAFLQSIEWPALAELRLSSTLLLDNSLAPLAAARSTLESVRLCNVPISDPAITFINQLRRLRELRISQTEITDAGLLNLGPLNELRSLHVADVDLCAATIEKLAAFPSLQTLNVNRTQASIPLAALGHCTRLDLNQTALIDQELSQLPAQNNVQYLDASYTLIRELPPMPVPHLETLLLDNFPLSVPSAERLASMPKLTALYLRISAIEDAQLEILAKSPQLKELHLSRTKLTDIGRSMFLLGKPTASLYEDGRLVTWKPLVTLIGFPGTAEPPTSAAMRRLAYDFLDEHSAIIASMIEEAQDELNHVEPSGFINRRVLNTLAVFLWMPETSIIGNEEAIIRFANDVKTANEGRPKTCADADAVIRRCLQLKTMRSGA